VILLIWTLLRQLDVLPANSAPSVPDVAEAMFSNTSALSTAWLQTARGWFAGLALATAIAVPLGMLIGLSRTAEVVTRPTVNFLRPVPSVALVPLIVVFLGTGLKSQMVMVCIASVWPILINTQHGARSIEQTWLEVGRVARIGAVRRLLRIIFPGAVPIIFTGVRTASSIAVIVAVASELVVGMPGLGTFILDRQRNGEVAEAYAGVVAAGLLGVLATFTIVGLERVTAGWHYKSRSKK
jgi:NitT/TauT family transport system permease protein